MVLLAVIAIALVGGAVALTARAVVLPRIRTVERLGQIGSYGFPAPEEPQPVGQPATSGLDRLAERLGGAVTPSLRESEREEVRHLLMAAGMYATSPGRFLGYRALTGISLTAAWLWLAPAAGINAVLFFVGLPFMLLGGWTVPLTLLRARAQTRLDEIDYDLPELIDSLIVTVEAGMGFSGALRMSARELKGPLGDEIGLALHEQGMGLSMEAALDNLSKRADTPAVRSFVRSVLQGETLGVSIGEILRGLAVEMRSRRRSAAEERAHRAPVKILFPLVLLIFPAILIILLYPALHNFTQVFGT